MNEIPNFGPETMKGADLSPEALAAEVAAESIRQWEKTLKDILSNYNNETKMEFEANLQAFISNVENYANPDRSDTDEGDKQFYQLVQKIKRVLEIAKEGHSVNEFGFLLKKVTFEDPELTAKLSRLFTQHYSNQ